MNRCAINHRVLLTLVVLFLLPAQALQAACVLSASELIFSTYSPFSSSPEDGVGETVVECTETTAYTLTLGPGNGTYQDRYMSGLENQLHYNLYIDTNRVTIWGDGSGDTAVVSGSETYEAHPVYGRIFSGQNVRPGSYQDSIVVRLEY